MKAMTWFDHETRSIWSQPWGRALEGDHRIVELILLPSQITTLSSWQKKQPQTLVVVNDLELIGRRQQSNPDFVTGLILNEDSTAYYYRDVLERRIVNDCLGDVPVVVAANDDSYQTYARQVDDQVLNFKFIDGELIDQESESTLDLSNGLAVAGRLRGKSLQAIPSLCSYNWAWIDFYREWEFYRRKMGICQIKSASFLRDK